MMARPCFVLDVVATGAANILFISDSSFESSELVRARCCHTRGRRMPAMCPPQTEPAPATFIENVITVAGGQLRGGKHVTLPVRAVGPLKFWPISSHDESASLFLAGVPACHRPLCNLKVWNLLKKSIETARDAGKQPPQCGGEDDFDFAGEGGAAELETPVKKKRRATRADGTNGSGARPTLSIDMPKFFGQAAPTIALTVLNNTKSVAILADSEHMDWLARYVHDERRQA